MSNERPPKRRIWLLRRDRDNGVSVGFYCQSYSQDAGRAPKEFTPGCRKTTTLENPGTFCSAARELSPFVKELRAKCQRTHPGPATGLMAYFIGGVVKANGVELPVEPFNASSAGSVFKSEFK
jgi:hypothetical protein